ncbi:sensor protein KdpD [Salmonella bongori]|nr:sensor protein KdpD [Salmonella bongori]
MNDEPLRPDPDRLLEQTPQPHRGTLKIFFGACAGVGKTWAMLAQAQRLRGQGLDVVIGVAETHGRKETAALLEGLDVLPPKRHTHRGRQIREFDLDAALARRPALILMDELAHSNAPGSRHPKRWQDIEELLEAGIDVFTTVNVQHLESLNDVVSGVTGFRYAKPSPIPFSMLPMKSSWSICRPTIYANVSRKVKCISPVRRNGLLSIFSARVI